MARPKHQYPTPAELEVLQIIWQHGPSTVREVMTVLNGRRQRAYTSVMSLMNVMVEKELLAQQARGRAFVYSAKVTQDTTQSSMLSDLLDRAFDGSASALVTRLLAQDQIDSRELDEIRATIAKFEPKKGGSDVNSSFSHNPRGKN